MEETQPTGPDPAPDDPLQGQPLVEVERDGVRYTLLGTAHISSASVRAVEALAATGEFHAIAVELCATRYQAMTAPDTLAALDIFQVIRQNRIGMVAANLALSAYQRRLAEQLGIEPGAEMRAAIDAAAQRGVALWQVDRDIGITLRRTSAALGFWRRMMLVSGLVASLIDREEVDEDEIERLKQGDILESSFHEFASRNETLHRVLISERDAYMAASLRQHASVGQAGSDTVQRVLAVVGAGHLAGLERELAGSTGNPADELARLREVPPPKPWGKWFGILLAVVVLGGFAWGFTQGSEVGLDFVGRWVLFTGLGGTLGCLLAGGHPLSILAAFLASPLTPLHPALSSGMVSAWVEAWLRRPRVADFSNLRDDAGSLRGWWRNRVSRTFVNFFLTNLGTAIGVYVAGWNILQHAL